MAEDTDGLVCPVCGGPFRSNKTIVHDPLYLGPFGHSPKYVCHDCWCEAWEVPSKRRNRQLAAIILLAEGYTQKEVAVLVGSGRRTIQSWIYAWRKNPKEFSRIVAHFRSSRVGTIQRT